MFGSDGEIKDAADRAKALATDPTLKALLDKIMDHNLGVAMLLIECGETGWAEVDGSYCMPQARLASGVHINQCNSGWEVTTPWDDPNDEPLDFDDGRDDRYFSTFDDAYEFAKQFNR